MQTAQLAILVSGAVGLGSPALTALFGMLRAKQDATRDRVEKDRADLRSVLDETLPVMFEHTTLLVDHERWLRDKTVRPGDPGSPPKWLSETRHKLYASNARLVVRRGRDDRLVVAFGHYLKPTDEAMDFLDVVHEEHDVLDLDDDQLAERAAVYWSAYEAFADECKAVAGNRS